MKTDSELHQDVLDELTWDSRLDGREIGVAAADGVVTLTGCVPSYADKITAERAVARVVGVKAVANDLQVKIPSAFMHSDTEIAHAIVNAFTWDIQVPRDTIKPSVADGWVTLDGEVEWAFQRDAAARAVRYLAGVRGVTNDIKVIPKHVSPADVTRSIRQALERRADRAANRITVDTTEGVVTLSGSVPSYGDRRAAEGAALSAPGVKEVRDELAVEF